MVYLNLHCPGIAMSQKDLNHTDEDKDHQVCEAEEALETEINADDDALTAAFGSTPTSTSRQALSTLLQHPTTSAVVGTTVEVLTTTANDIGSIVTASQSTMEIAEKIQKLFPGCNRSFKIGWLKEYPWMVYSQIMDGVQPNRGWCIAKSWMHIEEHESYFSDWDADNRSAAQQILSSITTFEFILVFLLAYQHLSHLSGLVPAIICTRDMNIEDALKILRAWASGTGTGSTERFDPRVNDDGENLCSSVMNREDFKVLPGDGTNHPTDPSQPSVSTNSRPIADAESAEQQIVSKLVPQHGAWLECSGKVVNMTLSFCASGVVTLGVWPLLSNLEDPELRSLVQALPATVLSSRADSTPQVPTSDGRPGQMPDKVSPASLC
eukprot:Em0021g346a